MPPLGGAVKYPASHPLSQGGGVFSSQGVGGALQEFLVVSVII